MLNSVARSIRTSDVRRKILFTLLIMALFRLGSFVPTPGVSYTNVSECIANKGSDNGLLGVANLFSGGALLHLSIFALGIMPYITASIIIQLLRVVIPRFEALYQEGQTGTAKLTQYTRYVTIALAVLQSATYVAMARGGVLFPGCTAPVIPNDSIYTLVLMVLTMTAGTGLVMWLGELITERGIGNGMSLLIFTSIAAQFPQSLWLIKTQKGWSTFGIVVAIGLVIMALVIFVEQCQRRIPVQYAKRMIGRRSYGGSSTYIPMKVNMAGVIPVIFASSILYLPMMATQFAPDKTAKWVVFIDRYMKQDSPAHMVMYFLLIVFFTYFYVAITFNPEEVATNIRKAGGFIPGIRAGGPTARYLEYVLSRVTAPGALYLGIIALIPTIAFMMVQASTNFPFGGASILIVVGVGLDTVRQIESQIQQGHYEGFLR